jgi:hypothetical protein
VFENLMTTKLDVFIHFLFNGRYLIRNIKRTFISLEIHGAVQFYIFFLFFFSVLLKGRERCRN